MRRNPGTAILRGGGDLDFNPIGEISFETSKADKNTTRRGISIVNTPMYCWYAMTIKEEAIREISFLASRADLCARKINFRHRSRKSTTTEICVGNEGGCEYTVPILAQKRMVELHIELLSFVRRCA